MNAQEISKYKRLAADAVNRKLSMRDMVIFPVEILKEIGCISPEIFGQWRRGEVETLENAFSVPIEVVREIVFFIRNLVCRYDIARLRYSKRSAVDNTKTLLLTRRRSLGKWLSEGFYVHMKATGPQLKGLRNAARKRREEQRREQKGYASPINRDDVIDVGETLHDRDASRRPARELEGDQRILEIAVND